MIISVKKILFYRFVLLEQRDNFNSLIKLGDSKRQYWMSLSVTIEMDGER